MSEPTAHSGYGLSSIGATGAVAAPVLPYLPPRPRDYRPKIGLVGCGGISEYHLRAYRAMGLEVVALCDRDVARAEKRRAEFYPGATVFADYHHVLARADIEVVDLALHPVERVEAIEAALRARKHVLSQKPFVLDLSVGERLAALADAHGVKLAVNQNGRWAPHFSYLAAAIHAGVIGDVASVDFMLQWDHTWTAGTPFEEIHHLILFDFGIHWFDMAARFMQGRQPERVWAAVARTTFQKMKPPMLAQVTIEYPGAQVRLNFNGHVQHGQEDRTVVAGIRGRCAVSVPACRSKRWSCTRPRGQRRRCWRARGSRADSRGRWANCCAPSRKAASPATAAATTSRAWRFASRLSRARIPANRKSRGR
jgi:predicted dehydrogenase